MKILVTGATGFLGQKLALRLQAGGHQVTALGRNESIGRKLAEQGFRFYRADLADREEILKACEQQEVVFHCGALSSPWGRYADFYAANVTGTRHVIEGCQAHGVKRLIHVSTPSLYFSLQDRYQVREDEPLPARFANHYAATKYLAEMEVARAVQEGLPVVTIRPRALFGPGDNAIIPRLIRANDQGFVPLIGGGRATIDVTYVENVVDALLLCMNASERVIGKCYNITNGQPIMLIELLEMLFARLKQPLRGKRIPFPAAYGLAWMMEAAARLHPHGREPLLTRYTVGVLAKSQTLSIEAAQRDLHYVPKISIEEGIDRFVNWWLDNQPRSL